MAIGKNAGRHGGLGRMGSGERYRGLNDEETLSEFLTYEHRLYEFFLVGRGVSIPSATYHTEALHLSNP